MSDPITPARIGKYLIRRLLGSGGMGRVYEALDPDIDRPVAIKQITLAADPQARERFVSEARTMGRLNHPNITTLLEFNAESEPPFLVLELLSGEDLSQWMLRPHRLHEQLQVLTDMARGLDAAHRAGILHRDLKPDNVRVLDDGHAKLLDFGIAQAGHSGLTAAGYFVGTPEFVAPEVMAGEAHSPAADLYALGLCCYVVLTGDNPFRGDTVQATVARVIQRVPPPISTRVLGLPDALAELIHACLAKQPELRPTSAGAVAAALAQCLLTVPADLRLREAPRPSHTLAQGVPTTPAPTRSTPTSSATEQRRRPGLQWAALALVAAGALWWWWPRTEPQAPVPTPTAERSLPPMPEPARLTLVPEPVSQPAPGLIPVDDRPAPAAAPAATTTADTSTRPAPSATPADSSASPAQAAITPSPPQPKPPAPATVERPPAEPVEPAATTTAAETRVDAAPAAAPVTAPVTTPAPVVVTVDSFEPRTVRAGRTVNIRIEGQGLDTIRSVQIGAGLTSDPRFRVGALQHEGDRSLRFTLAVARGVPLGSYAVQLIGPEAHADPLILQVSL